MSDQELRLIQHLCMVKKSLCPDLEQVTAGDTDPKTFQEIQTTLAQARGEFEPEPPKPKPLGPKRAPVRTTPAKRRLGQRREEDPAAMTEAIAFINQAIAEAKNSTGRVDRAVEAARRRFGSHE